MTLSPSSKRSLWIRGLRKYRFEIRHLAILLLVLIAFQIIVLSISQQSLQSLYDSSRDWYRQDAAERIANLTATSFELLLEATAGDVRSEAHRQQIIQDFNIIFSQQILDQNVESVSILIPKGAGMVSIRDGGDLYDHFYGGGIADDARDIPDVQVEELFHRVEHTLRTMEQIQTVVEGTGTFHVFVPFVPRGEYTGAVYMRSSPNLFFLTDVLTLSYDETVLAYAALIIIGLVAMFYISTRTLQERDDAQKALFEEQKQHLADQIHHQKELAFTKRIYHTHHKAEKVSGFIKEDLRMMTPETMPALKARIDKYISFIGRVIYDMKWYDPPLQTIRGPMFRTDVNALIRFLVDNIFRRGSYARRNVRIDLDLDPALPHVPANEYVIWEVLEPLIQNSLDHATGEEIMVRVSTRFDPDAKRGSVLIEDNGGGIVPELLEPNDRGTRQIFLEDVTHHPQSRKGHSGYGCYISHEIATQRLGWTLDAGNRDEGGARFTITFPCAGV